MDQSAAMSIPTKGETFAQLIEHLRKAQEAAAMLAHLHADESRAIAVRWIAVSEVLKLATQKVTELATDGLTRWN